MWARRAEMEFTVLGYRFGLGNWCYECWRTIVCCSCCRVYIVEAIHQITHAKRYLASSKSNPTATNNRRKCCTTTPINERCNQKRNLDPALLIMKRPNGAREVLQRCQTPQQGSAATPRCSRGFKLKESNEANDLTAPSRI